MEYVGARRVYAAGDLVDFIACGHLAFLGEDVARGERERPAASEEDLLVARKGDAHEAAYLEKLQAAGVPVVSIPRAATFEGRRAAARATLEAMRAGAEAIAGATFVELPATGDGWLGVADFAIRTDGASDLGDYHYEIWDAKLARTAKPSAIVQTCVYSELLARVQGTVPARVHVILGDGRVEAYETVDALPYVRAARARFVARMNANVRTYPEPVEHCARCRWLEPVCMPRRRADDHLSLVASMRRSQTVKLHGAGIATVAHLARARDAERPRKLESATYEKLRAQAALQVAARAGGAPRYELLKPQDGCGFSRIPAPDPGDLYFDMEGDPFFDGGNLEYLFGVASLDDTGERRFDSFEGHDRAGERRAFEAFVDFVVARRAAHPNAHVYHYATYEATALRRLAAEHGTREREVDTFLREEVLVDLLDVVRQTMRASFESYSLKKIEQFFRGERREEVTSAMGSVVMYERYLETRDRRAFDEIVRYNREDCYSTLDLHRWLLERRLETQSAFGVEIPFRTAPEANEAVDDGEEDALAASLSHGIDPETATDDERARWLAAQLISFHRREAKPAWWAFFDKLGTPSEELIDDTEAIGDLTPLDAQPQLFKKSYVYTLRFPAQEHKLKPGPVFDPLNDGRAAGTLESIDDGLSTLRLRRGPSLVDVDLPRALIAGKPIRNDKQRAALAAFAGELLRDDCATRFAAGRDLLRADPPRLGDRPQGATLDDAATTPEKLANLTLALDRSYLFVQGPPGAG
ncbi:MAG: TM0106 family RecB-like putative nuclease [Candidatus Eremiobacteraeota bacterium]|nr:TM0106 family RecB-like putative nuclease [Candidatus Eremiobacteraeota bacterium]